MTDIKNKKIIYTFDTWEDYDDLIQYLENEGATWGIDKNTTEWYYLEDMGYIANAISVRLKKGVLTYHENWEICYLPDKNDYEKVNWKKRKKKDISLAEFLGWEEGVKYRKNGKIYKVEGYHLQELVNGTHWKNVYVQTRELVDLRYATKYEPKVMIKTPFSSSKGTQYLSKERKSGRAFVAALLNSPDVIQEFTEDEADKLVRIYNLDDLVEIEEI